ncbi:MAG TPA: type II toxin-antitoxin system HipA family toxin [Aeromonadales bacterium]|nr:type II toxin-antitoxin system HipA family toxin [Aeromonadales bacterium]
MVKKIDTALVSLWGQTVGAVSWLAEQGYAVFEYDTEFLNSNLDISPIHMSLEQARKGDARFFFPHLNKHTFLGLPGLLADALPDKFGNSIIDTWLARQGRSGADFSPVERLCYTGKRAMGALEFSPSIIKKYNKTVAVDVDELVNLAQEIMTQRSALNVNLGDTEKQHADAIYDILRVGTSAGGARPKAVIAMDKKGHILSGQADVPPGYDYWIIKFDGVNDLELGTPAGYGRIEYAYYQMALAAGITMSECRLLQENGRAHFMSKRFDRHNSQRGEGKVHMQSLCGIAHYDFNMAGAYSYEQAFMIMRKLRLTKAEAKQQYRRMVFNVIARNQDDHTKNIAYLMQNSQLQNKGQWSLSPAFDVTYSHNPAGQWTNQHQMSVNGKRDHFTRADLVTVGRSISLSRPEKIIDEVKESVRQWPKFAKIAQLNNKQMRGIQKFHRLDL